MNFNIIKTVSIVAVTALLALFSLQGCVEYRDDPNCNYMSFEEFREKGIEVLPPREITTAGKIYVYKNLLLVQEVDKGIHVIDNSNKKEPQPKAFLKVVGNLDMAVKEGYLYLDSYMDLVILNINDINNIKEVSRTKDTFPYDPYQSFNGFYSWECGDYNTSKGILIMGER